MIVSISAPVSAAMRERIRQTLEAAGAVPCFVDRLRDVREAPVVHFGDVTIDFVYAHPSLRWIQTTSAGVDRLTLADRPFPREILLTNASGVFGVAGGEHILAMMLHFARGFSFYLANQRRGEWVRDISHARLLKGQTLVLLGLGDLGREVARRARAFDMRVIGVKRTPGEVEGVDRVVTSDRLDDVLPLADHLAITLPLTKETHHLLNARRLGLLPRGAYVYNIGRGAVIDQAALVDALMSGHVAGAGLDVFEEEPLPADSPLWRMENVLITPHIGADTPWDFDAAAEIFLDNFARYTRGETLRNVVDPSLGY